MTRAERRERLHAIAAKMADPTADRSGVVDELVTLEAELGLKVVEGGRASSTTGEGSGERGLASSAGSPLPGGSAADRTLGLFAHPARPPSPVDVLERAARRVGADGREVLAAVAIVRIDDAPLDDASAEAVLLGVRELRKVAAGGAS